jgi:hypothetical protein
VDTSPRQFGLIVAYLVPGFVGLAGVVPLVPAVGQWLQPIAQGDMGFGPPIYALLGATTVGLIVSCFRWALIDQFHHWTGVKRPAWNDSRLTEVLGGFDYLVQSHYRYYEFAGNMLVAVLWTYGLNRLMRTSPLLGLGTDLGILVITLVLFAASRDALAKYYQRTARLVGHVAEKGGKGMFNGNDHAKETGTVPKERPEGAEPEKKSSVPTKAPSEEGEGTKPAK